MCSRCKGRMKSLQGSTEHSNNRILELIIENSLLVNELSSHKVGIGSKVNEQQNIGLQGEEVGLRAVFNSEEHLREEIIRMSANLQAYVEATQCLKMEMGDGSWKHEFENYLTIEALKEKVEDLIADINIIGDNLTGIQSDTVTFDGRIPQKSYTEPVSLNSSKVEFEEKLKKCSALTKDFEQKTEEKDKTLDNEVQMFRKTDNGISHLKDKLTEMEFHLLNCKNDSGERQPHEGVKEQQKVLEDNAQMLREAITRISFLEQEVATKEGLLDRNRIEMEEQSWRFEFEDDILTMYGKHSFQEHLKHIIEIQGNLSDVGSRLVSHQNELEAARHELRKWKAEVDALKSDIRTSSDFVDQLQVEAESRVSKLAQERIAILDAHSQSANFTSFEKQEEIDSRIKNLEGTLSKKSGEVLEMMKKMEDSDRRSHSLATFLGLVEASTHEYDLEFAWPREELKLNHQEIPSLRPEVEEQNDRLTCYSSDVSDLKAALVTRDHDLLVLKQGLDSTSALQRDTRVQEQATIKGTKKEMDALKKVNVVLVARVEEEKQRVQQLQEALAEQSWKSKVELEMFTTVVWEGKAVVSVIWNKETAALLGEAQIHHVFGGHKPIGGQKEASNHRSLDHGYDGWIVECFPVLEITALRTEMESVQKQLKSDLQQLENHVSHRLNQHNTRLEGTQDLVNHLFQQCSVLPPNETEYLQTIQNLQKAETEVDMLGDEVDVLMDILEKVYSVLNHYFPIIQHYPGLAELVKVLRREILWRICPSNEG